MRTMKYFAMLLIIPTLMMTATSCNKEVEHSDLWVYMKAGQSPLEDEDQFEEIVIDVEEAEVMYETAKYRTQWALLSLNTKEIHLKRLETEGAIQFANDISAIPGDVKKVKVKIGPDSYVIRKGQRFDFFVPEAYKDGIVYNMDVISLPEQLTEIRISSDPIEAIVKRNKDQYPVPVND